MVNAWAALDSVEQSDVTDDAHESAECRERRVEEVEALAAIFGDENVECDDVSDGLGFARVVVFPSAWPEDATTSAPRATIAFERVRGYPESRPVGVDVIVADADRPAVPG